MNAQRKLIETRDRDNRADDEERQSQFWQQVPDDWQLVKGSEVYDVNPSYSPDAAEIDYIEMDALDTELPFPQYVGRRDPSEYTGKLFSVGDTLFARITPCTENGKAALITDLDSDVGIGSTEYIVLSPDRRKVHPWFLYYLTKSHAIHDYAVTRMRGSTGRQRVPYSVFRSEADVPLPPMEEQRKIAAVLYNLDKAIQNRQEHIEQKQRLKSGLMDKLFTEGYFKHELEAGAWQNSADKKPVDWDVQPANKIIDITRGASPRPVGDPELFGGDIPWVKIRDVEHDNSQTVSQTESTVTEKGSKKSKLVDPGTLIVANSGTVGFAVLTEREACVHDGWLILRNYEELDKKFLLHYVNWNQGFLQSLAPGSTQVNLNTQRFGVLDIPIPEEEEQEKIASVLDVIDSSIYHDRKAVEHLKTLRKGIRQDLLAGKRRLSEENIEIPEAVAALDYE